MKTARSRRDAADADRTSHRLPQEAHAAPLRRRRARLYRDDVLGAAYRVLGERDGAEDIAQEVFLKLLAARWRPERIRCARGLLMSTAVLLALARMRAEGRRRAREAEARRGGGGPTFSRDDLLDVRDAVLDLPRGLRAAVELRYFGGLSVKEVALTLGCAAETAKDRLARARDLLRERLGPAPAAFILPGLRGEGAAALPTIAPSVSTSPRPAGMPERGHVGRQAALQLLQLPPRHVLLEGREDAPRELLRLVRRDAEVRRHPLAEERQAEGLGALPSMEHARPHQAREPRSE
jgi:RNA polymerase sigma-70 factor (ECF subfamily)